MLPYPKLSFTLTCAEANPGSTTMSYVNNSFSITFPVPSVTPAALEDTNKG